MKTNTATALAFSDDWDAEEPTVVERERTSPGRIADWRDQPGFSFGLPEDVLVALLRSSDDPTAVTHRELPAVRS